MIATKVVVGVVVIGFTVVGVVAIVVVVVGVYVTIFVVVVVISVLVNVITEYEVFIDMVVVTGHLFVANIVTLVEVVQNLINSMVETSFFLFCVAFCLNIFRWI